MDVSMVLEGLGGARCLPPLTFHSTPTKMLAELDFLDRYFAPPAGRSVDEVQEGSGLASDTLLDMGEPEWAEYIRLSGEVYAKLMRLARDTLRLQYADFGRFVVNSLTPVDQVRVNISDASWSSTQVVNGVVLLNGGTFACLDALLSRDRESLLRHKARHGGGDISMNADVFDFYLIEPGRSVNLLGVAPNEQNRYPYRLLAVDMEGLVVWVAAKRMLLMYRLLRADEVLIKEVPNEIHPNVSHVFQFRRKGVIVGAELENLQTDLHHKYYEAEVVYRE